MGAVLTIITVLGFLATFLILWSLCRAAANADRWAEEERNRRGKP